MNTYKPTECCMRIPRTADGIGCRRPGVFVPQLAAWVNPLKTHAPLRMFLKVSVCKECSEDLGVDNLVSDAGWATLVTNIKLAGRQPPLRETLQLILTPIADAPKGWIE